MSYSVLFRYNAEHDAERAQDWYPLHAPEQVGRFNDDLAATVPSIRQSPYAVRVLRRDARRAPLKIFPYLVWYRIHDELQVIEVLAVVHDRRALSTPARTAEHRGRSLHPDATQLNGMAVDVHRV